MDSEATCMPQEYETSQTDDRQRLEADKRLTDW
jgi:hypothetical protein